MSSRSSVGHTLARIGALVGRGLVAAGVLLLLFVGYQLWGTSLNAAGAQKSLHHRYEQLLQAQARSGATTATTAAPGTPAGGPGTPASPTSDPATVDTPGKPAPAAGPAPKIGDPIGQIVIPKLHVNKTMVEGIGDSELHRGPGHYPSTPLPGQKGNAAVAGHRSTYGAPFADVDKLRPGDEITVRTLQGTFRYQVMRDPLIVAPNATEVLDDFGDNRLTLTACHPKYSAAKRIIIQAKLVGDPVPPLAGQTQGHTFRMHLDIGWAPYLPIVEWGLLCAAIWAVTWAASYLLRRRGIGWKRWAPYVAGVPLFLLALWVLFGNISTLLPSNF